MKYILLVILFVLMASCSKEEAGYTRKEKAGNCDIILYVNEVRIASDLPGALVLSVGIKDCRACSLTEMDLKRTFRYLLTSIEKDPNTYLQGNIRINDGQITGLLSFTPPESYSLPVHDAPDGATRLITWADPNIQVLGNSLDGSAFYSGDLYTAIDNIAEVGKDIFIELKPESSSILTSSVQAMSQFDIYCDSKSTEWRVCLVDLRQGILGRNNPAR